MSMYTVVETATFQAQAADIWSADELAAFIDWLAVNPLAGDVVQGAQGARVIYFNRLEHGFLLLLAVYAKSEQENISARTIQGLKDE